MDKERRHRRLDSPPPCKEAKIKVKQEKLSPSRPKKARRSSSPSDRSSASPPPQRRRASRSPPKRRDRSPGRRGSRSPRNRRSKSPRCVDGRIKREQEEHRGNEERRRRDRPEGTDDRHHRDADRARPRGRGGDREDREGRAGGLRGRDRDGQTFQQQQADRERHDERRRENRQRADGDFENPEFGQQGDGTETPVEKDQPNFELSGALVEDTNTFRGVVIKYNEPPEARIPKRRWRLYPFKNDEPLPVMYIHRQSAYLLGRQRKIADIPIDHPSCSKQHAVFQYRLVAFTRADGTSGRRVRPYIIDLGSGNGTYLNNQRIDPQRYYELKEKDVLKFGFSSREYVLLHESSDTTEVDERPEDEDDEGLDE
ncbi:smad nuclear-interacting protein 1 [Amia ocellicauda]|uniref:smad nuclear-interacting protein 1 n=1 Tax=Amia ocellicauda TaxID=2972642 RepID=UPI003464C05B